jgi:hypothetical protein
MPHVVQGHFAAARIGVDLLIYPPPPSRIGERETLGIDDRDAVIRA